MKKYPYNSPQAMARILIMQLIGDGNFDPSEIDELDHLNVYEVLGITRKDFIQVLQAYCNDLSDEADEEGNIHLVDKQRIDDLLETVEDPKKRVLVAALALDIAKSDHDFSEVEMAIFAHILQRWHLTLDDLQAAFSE
ncbi:MAG: hypothetical protein H6R07_837 [Proteobacteria bacterium]|nr:hypothetical protein [Pseudomonadota bacterium]